MKRNYVNEKERKENYIGRRIRGKLFDNTFGAEYLLFSKYHVKFNIHGDFEYVIFYISDLNDEIITTLTVPMVAVPYIHTVKNTINLVERLYEYYIENNAPVLKQTVLFDLFDDEDLSTGVTSLLYLINNIKSSIKGEYIRSAIIYNELYFKLDCSGSNLIKTDIPKLIYNSLVYYKEPSDKLISNIRDMCYKFNRGDHSIKLYPEFNQTFGITIMVNINGDFTKLGKGFSKYKCNFKSTLNNLIAVLKLHDIDNNSVYKVLELPNTNGFILLDKDESKKLESYYDELVKGIRSLRY